jgi:cyanate permease
MPRNLVVMIVASLGFFFVTATTFTSLGYVLFTMAAELGWSKAAAGLSFALLGLACGLGSSLPPLVMKALGTRLTMALGAAVLAAGFLLAALVEHLGLFFVATSLMGVGFSLVAPAPAVFLIATWFPRTSARMMGFYFMAGAAGGIAGPLIVGAILGATGSWRMHWATMAVLAFGYGLLCLVGIRDAVKVESADQVRDAGTSDQQPTAQTARWTVRAAMRSPAFIMLACVLTVVQTAVTTIHSVMVAHVASLGVGPAPGALAMSLLAFAGTIAKGVTGALTERAAPKLLLVVGLAAQAAAMAMLYAASGAPLAYAAAVLFGAGWGLSWLSGVVLLLRYFGPRIAGDLTAMATLVTTFAVLGPVVAGRIADDTGSYAPALFGFALLLAGTTLLTALLLRRPAPDRQGDADQDAEPIAAG